MDYVLQDTFNDEAIAYDNNTHFLLLDYEPTLDKVIEQISLPQNRYFTVLDIGCGTGNLTKRIRDAYPNAVIYALDFSREMIEVAKGKCIEEINYVEGDMFNLDRLDFPYFDVIVSSYVFHNLHTLGEHRKIFSLIHDHLAFSGKIIFADLIEILEPSERNRAQSRLVELMIENGVPQENIIRWMELLEAEDTPLTKDQNISLLNECGFNNVKVFSFLDSDSAVFSAIRDFDIIQLKSELLFRGLKQNDFTKQLFFIQNPESVWKTGNNGIFIDVGGLKVLVSVNHESNHQSPFEIKGDSVISLYHNNERVDVDISLLSFPEWFSARIPELDNSSFSKFFVFEGDNYLHLAYKGCSFSYEEKCKFCSTERRTSRTDSDVNDICKAISTVIGKIPTETHICLGGGTYKPFKENVQYFSKIIKCIRKYNADIPIWVEMIPPEIHEIEQLILDGATAFGFNIEIWDEELRSYICPGKSQIAKEQYIEACKYVSKRLGPNRVGSCIIVGFDSFANVKNAIDFLVSEGIEPCILPYKKFDCTDLGQHTIPNRYQFDFYRLSKYAAETSMENGIVFSENQGCLKCPCCSIMHDFQSRYLQGKS